MTTRPSNTAIQDVHCPRCGYDLAGVVASWAESCPVRGVCSECGVEFSWGKVLGPDGNFPRWFVEAPHEPPGLRRDRMSVWKTLWMLVLPWRFWKRVEIEMPVRLERIAWWTGCIFGVLLAAHLTVIAAGLFTAGAVGLGNFPANMTAPSLAGTSAVPARWATAAAGPAVWPFAPALDQPTLRERGGAGVKVVQTWMPPRDIVRSLRPGHPVICAIVFCVVLAVVFMCLPVTRQRAKVRWELVVRVAGYSFAWLGVALVWGLAADILAAILIGSSATTRANALALMVSKAGPLWSPLLEVWWFGSSGDIWLNIFMCVVPVAWVMVYWWHALTRGLRMREALTVFLACMIPALIAVFLCWLAHPGTLLAIRWI